MKRFVFRLLALALCMSLLWTAGLAESPFLSGEGEEIVQNADEGFWSYRTNALSITINRRSDDTPRVWYEVEVFASEEEPLRTFLSEGKRPGRKLVNPLKMAKQNQLVLAITDDFSGYRLQNDQKVGIVIREGIVLGNKTRNSRNRQSWPNLDTLAVYPDGSMKANVSDAYKADEYLAQGATNVFAFGPAIISDGVIPEYVLDEKYYPYNEPRLAIGMIEPFHYMIVAVEGRDDGSKGARNSWVAQKMLELGCTEALNLDGGGTAVLMFMGEVLNRSPKNMRSINSLIGFGQSEAVPAE